MADTVDVFISSSPKDLTIAEEIKVQLDYLAARSTSKPALRSFLSAANDPLNRDVIADSLRKARWLISVYDDTNLWLFFEAGLFAASRPEAKTRIVVLHDMDETQLPAALSDYSSVRIRKPGESGQRGLARGIDEVTLWSDSSIGKFLNEFCKAEDGLNDAGTGEYRADIAKAASSISAAFDLRRADEELEDVSLQLAFILSIHPPFDDSTKQVPDEAMLTVSPGFFEVFGIAEPSSLASRLSQQISWGYLRNSISYAGGADVDWMDRLGSDVMLAAAGRRHEPIDRTLRTPSGRSYRMILTRQRLFASGRRQFEFILIEAFARKTSNELDALLPPALILAASRWRFAFFENWPLILSRFELAVTNEDFVRECTLLRNNIERIESENGEFGIADLADLFGDERKVEIQQFIDDWVRTTHHLNASFYEIFGAFEPDKRPRFQEILVDCLAQRKAQIETLLELSTSLLMTRAEADREKEIVQSGIISRKPPRATQLRPTPASSERRWVDESKARRVSLLFATTREPSVQPSRYFSGERSPDVSYGRASVLVPKKREIGELRLPFELKLFSITIYKQALDPNVHFSLEVCETIARESWVNDIRSSDCTQALVFVHGFNVSFVDSVYRCAQIAWDIGYTGVPVLFSWASRGEIADYFYDQTSARLAADPFTQVLDDLHGAGIKKIHVLAHSMGNFLILNALSRAKSRRLPKMGEIIMAAPDVDRDEYVKMVGMARLASAGMTLYASSRDRALALSKKLAGDIPRAGDVPVDGPILVEEIDAIDASVLGADIFGLNHGTFASNKSILNDVKRLLQDGMRPPHNRLVELRGMPEGEAPWKWWRYVF